MAERITDDKLIAAIIERAEASENINEINAYIAQVADRCLRLCKTGLNLRVLNEYKFMVENLRKKFNL